MNNGKFVIRYIPMQGGKYFVDYVTGLDSKNISVHDSRYKAEREIKELNSKKEDSKC